MLRLGSASLVGNTSCNASHIIAGGIKHVQYNPFERGYLEATSDFPWAFAYVPFLFVDFNLSFIIINRNHEYNNFRVWRLLLVNQ